MNRNPITRRSLVLLGAGGHAKVLLSLARTAGWDVIGVCDPQLMQQETNQWRDLPVLGGDEALDRLDPGQVGLINGVGQLVSGNTRRRRLFMELAQRSFHFPALVHPAAIVDASATLGQGVQVMAGAVLQADCVIGENSIINTAASVDHDCHVGAHVHIAPGVTLCGAVLVGDEAFLGTGCTVIQGISIGKRAMITAGAVVQRNIPCNEKFRNHAAKS